MTLRRRFSTHLQKSPSSSEFFTSYGRGSNFFVEKVYVNKEEGCCQVSRSRKAHSKRLSLTVLASAVALTQLPLSVSFAATPFSDVPEGYWAEPAISALVAKGIVSGKSKDRFYPEDSLTRAEFATLLVRSLNLPPDNDPTPVFRDVGTDHWAFTYIQTAYKHHLISGISQDEFGPEENITRQDMAVMIANALQLKQVPDSLLQSSLSYRDVDAIADYAKKPIAASTYLGVMSGYPDGTFQPQDHATRAAAASVIAHMIAAPADKLGELRGETKPEPQPAPEPEKPAEKPKGTLSIYPQTVSLTNGATQTFTATAIDPDGNVVTLPIKWSVSGGIGTIDAQGHLTAQATGTGKVTASVTFADGTVVTSDAQVEVKPAVKRLEIQPGSLSTTVGQETKLTVKGYDSNNQPTDSPAVVWSVSGEIGEVNSQGVFVAKKAGKGTITATLQGPNGGTVSQSIDVTVADAAQTPGTGNPGTPGTGQGNTGSSGSGQTNPGTPGSKHVAFTSTQYGSFKPTQTVNLTLQVKNQNGQVDTSDNGRVITVILNGPDGSQTLQGQTVNGTVNFAVSKTVAGTYTATVSASGVTLDAPATFTVVPGDAVQMSLHVAPSTFIKPLQTVTLQVKAQDAWGNAITSGVTFSADDNTRGTFGTTGNPMVGTFTPKNQKGPLTIRATIGNKTVTQPVYVYTEAADLVRGKGDWMMWRDWKNYPVQDTIQRLKAAGVTHVYLEVSTTSDGFYGQDALDDFLPQAHQAGIAVLGWIYADLKDPWKDASQTVDVINYTTPSGDQIDGLAADLEENLSAYNIQQFSKGIRDNFGPYYPMIAVVYPATWRPTLPWSTLAQYYDVMAPMVYWHYKERAYTYTDAYNAIKAEIEAMHEKVGDKPIHIIGQSYNMFDTWQYPTADEIKGAMQAAKDGGAVGYSTYRGRTATDYEWNQFASFPW
jgi:hypothetical protein